MMSYNVSFHSLRYPNSERSWQEVEKVMQNGFWMLFQEINLEGDTRGFTNKLFYSVSLKCVL